MCHCKMILSEYLQRFARDEKLTEISLSSFFLSDNYAVVKVSQAIMAMIYKHSFKTFPESH